jgi:hypothetical protein
MQKEVKTQNWVMFVIEKQNSDTWTLPLEVIAEYSGPQVVLYPSNSYIKFQEKLATLIIPFSNPYELAIHKTSWDTVSIYEFYLIWLIINTW